MTKLPRVDIDTVIGLDLWVDMIYPHIEEVCKWDELGNFHRTALGMSQGTAIDDDRYWSSWNISMVLPNGVAMPFMVYVNDESRSIKLKVSHNRSIALSMWNHYVSLTQYALAVHYVARLKYS